MHREFLRGDYEFSFLNFNLILVKIYSNGTNCITT